MGEATIQVNPKGTLQVRRVGREKTPIIVIDDFAVDTRALIERACAAGDFGPEGSSAYPGIRAKLPRDYVIAVLNSVYRLLFRAYAVPAELNLKPVNTVYSLISTPEASLSLAQRVPHYDSNGPFYLAILHYLNPGDFCATGLFRHRPTGFERITEDRLDAFVRSSEAFIREHGEPPRRYIDGSTAHYKLYDRIEYRPNRLVAYPGNLLHSGLVDPARDIDPNPRSGRLTANIFVDFRPATEGTGP
jgi:hypothetical protein